MLGLNATLAGANCNQTGLNSVIPLSSIMSSAINHKHRALKALRMLVFFMFPEVSSLAEGEDVSGLRGHSTLGYG